MSVQATTSNNSLVAHWGFEEVTSEGETLDLSGFNNIGIVKGATLSSVGQVGKALMFEGTNQYVDVKVGTEIEFGTGDFTASLWVQPSQIEATMFLLWYGTPSTKQPQWWLRASNGKLQFCTSGGGSEYILSTDCVVLQNREWTHITVKRKSSELSIYINGVQVKNGINRDSHNVNGEKILRIGKAKAGEPRSFKGMIDEVKLYNLALTDSQIERNYLLEQGVTPIPVWPSNTIVVATNVEQSRLTLSWTPAMDNIEVTNYRITWGNKEIFVKGDLNTVIIQGLRAGMQYEFKVEAGDSEGNWTKNGPSVKVHTRVIHLRYTIPFIDLSKETERQILTDREAGQYLGHPDSVLLDDGTIYTMYPKGHGMGSIVLKKSSDGGITWSERLNTPASWATSQETPTVYKVEKPDGTVRLQMISGLLRNENTGFQTAYSDDNGATWSEFKTFFKDGGKAGIVAMASLTRLKNAEGSWAHCWMGVFHDFNYNNWKTYLTFDINGNEQWSEPVRLLAEYDAIEKYAGLCEIEIIRSPDGNQLALLARAQHKKTNAMIAFSNDEGYTWTEPKEMQGALMGERHKATYDPVSGRLLITFRDIVRRSDTDLDDWVAGDWEAWVGTYDDLINFREGQYRIRLMEDFTPSVRSGDTGYAGNVVLADGTYVLTSYGYFDPQDTRVPYIVTVRLKLNELDAMASEDELPPVFPEH